jgi:hypothetical protein
MINYKANTVEGLLPLFELLDWLMGFSDYQKLDKFLKLLDVNDCSEHVLVGILRNTYMLRNDLNNWDFLLLRSLEIFKERKLDYKSLLNGLI